MSNRITIINCISQLLKKKVKKRKVYLSFKENIWARDFI